jgi:hypothetical protein
MPRYNTGGNTASGSLTMIEIKKWGVWRWSLKSLVDKQAQSHQLKE